MGAPWCRIGYAYCSVYSSHFDGTIQLALQLDIGPAHATEGRLPIGKQGRNFRAVGNERHPG
jgi:hypothetical protein